MQRILQEMPYDYKILVYNLTVSKPTKIHVCFISARPMQMRNTCESALTSQLRFGSIFLYSVFVKDIAVDESGDVLRQELAFRFTEKR